MTTKVVEKMKFCRRCHKKTFQRKNSIQMNWLMHLFLAVITAGGWVFIWGLMFIWHVFNKTATSIISHWVCSVCGEKN